MDKKSRREFLKRLGISAGALTLPRWLKAEETRGKSTKEALKVKAESPAFERAAGGHWKTLFSDDCTGDYTQRWFLDGEVGTVVNKPDGMVLTSGPDWGNDAHHMVLWTRELFIGDVKIEYEFQRLDASKRGVNIIYIQATGSGDGPYKTDITEWSSLRKNPSMSLYFNNMNTYHISYSVNMPGSDYIRARRYVPKPEGKGIDGTEIIPDFGPTDLFKPDVVYLMTIIKRGQELFMLVKEKNGDRSDNYHWKNEALPPITEGRIGLRQMYCKRSRYANFRVSVPQ
jgi:hypothetical protein